MLELRLNGRQTRVLPTQMCYFLWQGEVPCNYMGLSVSWATEKLSMSGSLPSSCFFLMLLMGYCSQGISGQADLP